MGESDSTKTLDGTSAFADGCAHCGSTFSTGEWYPVVVEAGDDGKPAIHSFCDVECKAAWKAAN